MKDEKWWYFTFGVNQPNAGKYVKIYGTYNAARNLMFDKFGDKWAFQYPEKEWKRMKKDKNRSYPLETELEVYVVNRTRQKTGVAGQFKEIRF